MSVFLINCSIFYNNRLSPSRKRGSIYNSLTYKKGSQKLDMPKPKSALDERIWKLLKRAEYRWIAGLQCVMLLEINKNIIF